MPEMQATQETFKNGDMRRWGKKLLLLNKPLTVVGRYKNNNSNTTTTTTTKNNNTATPVTAINFNSAAICSPGNARVVPQGINLVPQTSA